MTSVAPPTSVEKSFDICFRFEVNHKDIFGNISGISIFGKKRKAISIGALFLEYLYVALVIYEQII